MNSANNRLKRKNEFDGNLRYGAKKFHNDTSRIVDKFPEEYNLIIQDTNTNQYLRKGNFWETLDVCPICSSNKFKFFLKRFGLDYYKCESCTHKFLSPRIKEEKAGELYGIEKSMTNVYKQDLQSEVDKLKFQYGLDLIEDFSTKEKGSIVDIGCGAGQFIKLAAKIGWDTAIGIDINEKFLKVPQNKKGVQFINSEFRNLDLKKLNFEIDCVTMWDVLEHVYDPVKMVKEISASLSDEGLLFILVPNSESLASRIIREKSPSFCWQHVSSFSAKSLKFLLENNGFECLFLETIITEIDNIKSYLSGENPYSGYGDPENLFEFITPEYIHKNLMGSRLLGLFKNTRKTNLNSVFEF